jgi:hypothetical protein
MSMTEGQTTMWSVRASLLAAILVFGPLGTAAQAGDTVPIHGFFRGTFRSESSPLLGPTLVHMEAQGTLSHVGRVRAVTSSPNVSVDLLRFRLLLGQSSWSGVITAFNGDELHGTYTYRALEVPFSPVTGQFSYVADLVITGGTGRFAGASGSGIVTGIGNGFTDPWTFSVVVDGVISNVRAAKRRRP